MSNPNDKPPPSSSNKPNTTQENSNPNANTTTTTNDSGSNSKSNDSLPSRIQSSASTLARNAFFSPSGPADVTSSLTSGVGNKVGPASATGSGTAAAGQGYYTEASRTSGSAGWGSAGNGKTAGTSFRSSSGQYDDGAAEGVFQRTYHDGDEGGLAFTSLDDTFTEGMDNGKGKGKQADIPSSSFDHIWESQHQHHHYHHQQPDGTDVLNLLTSPTFNPDNPDNVNDYDTDLIPTDLSDYQDPSTTAPTLTPTEIQILETFRRADPDPSSLQGQPQQRGLSSTSLVPDISSFLDTVPAGQQTANDATALRDAVLTGLPGAEDWVAVEERYHDEVWGYLKPALEEAAREMENSHDGQGGGSQGDEGPAVARLKMILRHMRA